MNTVALTTTTRQPEFVVADAEPAQLIKELRTIAYRCGFDAYCNGQRLEDMQTDDMRRGWWAALDAHAACESGYDVAMGW